MKSASETIGHLFVERNLSQNVKAVVRECALDHGADEPTVTVLSLLRAAAQEKFLRESDARALAARLFAKRLENESVLSRFSGTETGVPTWPLSPGLRLAFDDTEQLRARVGGKDRYFGMRHLMFSILSCREAPLATEMNGIFELLDLRRGPAMRAAADYLLAHLEAKESEAEWLKIFGERGVPGGGGVPISQRDDPWAQNVVDRSGAQREAEAFAKMILATTFEPPLAVGVFGDWGSGKSFFLRLVHDEVTKFKPVDSDSSGKDDGEAGVDFLRRVAQIRFNAWHYAETNLWASLVTHIFTDLDRSASEGVPGAAEVIERLSAARELTVSAAEELIARRRNLREAEVQERKSQEALSKAQGAPAQPAVALAKAAWNTAVESEGIERLQRDVQVLGIDAAAVTVEDLRHVVQDLDEEVLGRSVWRGIFHTLTRAPVLIALVLVTVGVAAAFNRLGAMAGATAEALATIGGFIAAVTGALGFAATRARTALTGLRRFRTSFERAVEQQAEAERDALAKASDERAKAEVAAAAANAALQDAREKVEAVSREYSSQIGETRVYNFVRGRIASGVYAGQLGFVATVRQDFEELSRLMQPRTPEEKEAAAKELGAHQERIAGLLRAKELTADEKAWLQASADAADQNKGLDRIILYIDDLDRCSTKKVVEVLQAIHLLLAFPLFVVFVAVDVRWLRHALEMEYSGQIEETSGATATAGDYLEKIFQIPYWVRPLGGSPTMDLLRDHLAEDIEIEQTDEGGDDTGTGNGQQIRASAALSPPAPNEDEQVHPPAIEASRLPRLRMKKEEADFIEKMGAYLDGSPRRTLRFVNSYRLIKASLDDAALARLGRGQYRELITLLAVSIAADALYPFLACQLRQDPLADDWFEQAVAASQAPATEIELARKALAELGAKSKPDALIDYALLIERFSFHPSLREMPAASKDQKPDAPPTQRPTQEV